MLSYKVKNLANHTEIDAWIVRFSVGPDRHDVQKQLITCLPKMMLPYDFFLTALISALERAYPFKFIMDDVMKH